MPTVSNPATLQSVIDTFGSGGSPINLFAYRRGQSYVPDNIPAYNVVSTTEPALSTFAGLTYPPLYLPPDIIQSHSFTSASETVNSEAFVGVELRSNGSGRVFYGDSGTPGTIDTDFTWLLAGSAGDYYAFMDNPTGDPFDGGGTGSPQQLNLTRTWTLTAQAIIPPPKNITKSLSSTLRIRNSAGTNLITSPVTFSVEAILNNT